MTRLFLCALLLPALALSAPPSAPYPGGIAVIALGPYAERPDVRFRSNPVLVTREEDGWVAVVGIPLDEPTGTATLLVGDQGIEFEIEPHKYREQHLTVKPSYVNPDPAALERIGRESALIAAAKNHFSSEAPPALRLQAPVPGKRSDSFGSRRFFNGEPRSPHRGMDISGGRGTPIGAPLDGKVLLTGNFYFTGNAVFLDHGAGLVSLYAHLDSIAVAEGDVVRTGDKLGEVGATGRVTGAHLHFATYLNGTPVNPALLLVPRRQ
ncbi:MAG: peptidoglycan DD-metalloendopeptidase family protein [Woeseia sp.]|nr:peptidoglycan DD-metalloendopeptidase family protein [Woeseia sp.]MBT8095972.1 peptidoglycan DD-metalloendopeptidase family protein [Woeseia sp.]NNE60016.1 peptidoglycan DD-metalloendopeptidase family protein [Woeseia sp.]NNL55591.1 peptidoglycan DD-metalloendopeptidase family protein [Woeseia sp.]